MALCRIVPQMMPAVGIKPGPWRTEDTVFVSEGKSIRQQMYEVHTDLISVREKWSDDGNTDD